MSAFSRLPIPTFAARRAYSSFFSSKPGGGRYFNSAKPPKAVIPGSSTKNNGNKAVDSSDSKVDGVQASAGSGGGNTTSGAKAPNQIVNATTDEATHSSKQSSSSPSSVSPSTSSGGTASGASDASAKSAGSPGQRYSHSQRQHPVVNAKDFKLHQFFSLHRPLLLLPTPSSILTPAPANIDLSNLNSTSDAAHSWLLDEFPEASMDADAAAARQLTRALTMNHAGATVIWEATLRRLGLNVDQDTERAIMQQQWSREWQEVMMDSTKRKRRKKMKKHKLVISPHLPNVSFIPTHYENRLKKRRKVQFF